MRVKSPHAPRCSRHGMNRRSLIPAPAIGQAAAITFHREKAHFQRDAIPDDHVFGLDSEATLRVEAKVTVAAIETDLMRSTISELLFDRGIDRDVFIDVNAVDA